MGRLFDRLSSFEALHAAATRALRGKRDKPVAAAFFAALERNLFDLSDELRSRSYQPGAYRSFWIHDPKPRLISAAPFRDRVVHHAFTAAVEPLFERRFIHHSYACRVGRGSHRALEQFVRWGRGARWVLKLDVAKFFPSIDHEILKSRLDRVLYDSDVRALAHRIIDGSNAQEEVRFYFPRDDLLTRLERRVGLPIGNLTSQFFGNVYLDSLDHLVTDRLRFGRYLRYVDDLCVFADDKGALTELRAAIAEHLLGQRLRLNEGKSRLRQLREGVVFLGFVVRPHDLRLAGTAVRRNRRRVRGLRRGYAERGLDWAEVERSLRAFEAHAEHGATRALQRSVARASVFRRAW